MANVPEVERTVYDIWNEFTDNERMLTYELVGQALENRDYDREALIMFDDEKRIVVEAFIKEAMK